MGKVCPLLRGIRNVILLTLVYLASAKSQTHWVVSIKLERIDYLS